MVSELYYCEAPLRRGSEGKQDSRITLMSHYSAETSCSSELNCPLTSAIRDSGLVLSTYETCFPHTCHNILLELYHQFSGVYTFYSPICAVSSTFIFAIFNPDSNWWRVHSMSFSPAYCIISHAQIFVLFSNFPNGQEISQLYPYVYRCLTIMCHFTGWFLDIRISKRVHMNMYTEGLPQKLQLFWYHCLLSHLKYLTS